NPAPGGVAIAPDTLPSGTAGAAYSQALTASGPAGPYTFEVTSGSLPDGLSLGTDGTLAGTPTTAGSFDFIVTATSAAGQAGSRAYMLTVDPAAVTVEVAPATLPGGQVGTFYSQTFTAAGSPGPFTFAVTTGALPDGLSLDGSGILSGTPGAAGAYS